MGVLLMSVKHSNKYKAIGLTIKRYRKMKNMTQEELADKLSISLSYLTKIEAQNCDKPFSLEIVFDIAEALDIPIINLFEDIN
jgi:transcriptional regulator with XRE-family HTH domain